MRIAGRFRHVPYVALELNAEQLDQLARRPEVTTIQIDELMRPLLNDTIPQIGADLSWLQGYSGNGQTRTLLVPVKQSIATSRR